VQPLGIDIERGRVDAEPRRQPGDAAARSDEAAAAGDDLRLHPEIVARRHPRTRADHAVAGETVVGVLVEHQPGIEQHHRQAHRRSRDERPQPLAHRG
jgi:hypothetical protein